MLITTNLNSKNIKLFLISLLLGLLVVINLYVINKVISDSGQVKQDERMDRMDRNMIVYQ